MAFGDTFGNSIINVMRNTASTAISAIWASLHSTSPGSNGINQVTGGSYTRKALTLNAPASKTTTNTSGISFTGMPAVTVTHAGIWKSSASTAASNFLIGGALTASKTLSSGDTLTFNAGDFDVTLT